MVPVTMVFSSVVRGCETVGSMYGWWLGGMMDGPHGSCDDGSVVRGCKTVGCMYCWWYDGWFSWFL